MYQGPAIHCHTFDNGNGTLAAVAMALEIVLPSYFTLGHPGTQDLPALSFDETRARARPMKKGRKSMNSWETEG